MKRKLYSVILAGILAAGSIFPGGSVFAESPSSQEITVNEGNETQEDSEEGEQDSQGPVEEQSDQPENETLPEIQEPVQEEKEEAESAVRNEEEKPAAEAYAEERDQVVIYHTNDIHGAFDASEGGSVGLAKTAALKEETENALLVDAGDATQGLPLVSLSQGSSAIDLMNTAGYDLMTAGNHEFDYGLDQLFANASLAQFPILAANVHQNGSPVLEGKTAAENNGENAVLTVGDKKIGFFGILTGDTQNSTNPGAVSQLEFKDEVETAKEQIDILEAQEVDAIVAVCHMGDQAVVDCTSVQLADALTGEYQDKVDVIIDGHSHTQENREENGVLIVQTGTGMTRLGKVTLTFDGGDDPEAAGEFLSEADLADVTPDPEVAAKIAEIQADQEAVLDQKATSTETALWGGTINGIAEARVYETNLGDLAADAFVNAASDYLNESGRAGEVEYVFGAVNGGGIRAGIAKGEITLRDLVTVFPFSNTLMIKKVTPAILYQTMETSVSYQTGQSSETGMLEGDASGGYLQISGFEVSYDPTAAAGEKVISIRVPGETEGTYTELSRDDQETEIALVSNSFIMAGGSGHTVLGQLPLMAEIGGELETVRQYLTDNYGNQPVDNYPVQGNRIFIVNENAPETYEAKIQIVDSQGNPVADKEMSYYVDDNQGHSGTTDENGILKISVSKGPHGVKLTKDQAEIYINNYTGNGIRTDITSLPSLEYTDEGGGDSSAEHTITYVLNGGTNHRDNPDRFKENQETIRLKDPARSGYRFMGWYLDEEFREECTEIASGTMEDITLYAKWKKDGLEPNDSWDTAVNLRVPSKTESYISGAEDVDYYRFSLSGEDRISIRLTQPEDENVYYDIVLYNKDKEVVKKSQMSMDQSIVQTLQKGTYYIKAASLNGESSSQPYVLRISRIAGTGLDFSEQNLLTQSLHPDSDVAFDLGAGLNSGGHYLMSTAYFARWSGPLLEGQDPYPEYDVTGISGGNPVFDPSEDEVEVVTDESPAYHMQNAIWLPMRADPLDNDYIKSAIYTYGGVDAYYLDAGQFRNEEKASVYVPELSSEEISQYSAGGHYIILVGWDDNYSKENFAPAVPPGDGAFIFKNSWGEETGEEGYYYISYYSYNLLQNPGALYFMEEGTDNYNTIYQYDPFGYVGSLSSQGDIYAANVFTANSQEKLRAVSFMTKEENTDYEIYVEIQGNRQKVADGSMRYAGYKTVRLQNEISLQAGEEFKVIVKFSGDSGETSAALEYPTEGYSQKADSREGISFISQDGENWQDLYVYKANPCIKAFTYNDSAGETLTAGVVSETNINEQGSGVDVSSGKISGYVLENLEGQAGSEMQMSEDGKALGAQIAGLQTDVSKEEAPIANLPQQYDLRQIGAVTSVKDQYAMGSCWTFGAMGSAESILLRNENASYSYPMDIQIQGEKTITLTKDNPEVVYEAMAQLSTDVAATDVIIWELTGDLDSIELAEGPTRSASGETIPLFTAKQEGTITLTAVSAADETRSDTIMINIQTEDNQETRPSGEPTVAPSVTAAPSPSAQPTKAASDVRTPTRPASKSGKNKKSDSVSTGDTASPEQWLILTVLGAGAISAMVIRRRIKNK
ncbi:MAG: lectin like domain-containing protein [Ruminococcus sp.]